MLNSIFPSYGEKNIKIYYLLSLFSSSWFQIGSWLFFALIFVSEETFALYEAIAFALAALMEIPSGAIADLIGRKKTVVISFYLLTLGCLLFTLAPLGRSVLFIGNILIILSFAFKSGALEALIYDELKLVGKEDKFDDIQGKANSISPFIYTLAGLVGGLLWKWNVYLPWTITTVFFGFAAVASHFLVDNNPPTKEFNMGNFIQQSKEGFNYLFDKSIRPIVVSLVIIIASYYMWTPGIIRVYMGEEFNYDGETLSYLVSIAYFSSIAFNYLLEKIREKFGDKYGFAGFSVLIACGWILSYFFTGQISGAIVFFALSIGGVVTGTWNSVIMNKLFKSEIRATSISTFSLLTQIPYILIVIFYGKLAASGGTQVFYLFTGIAVLIASIIFVVNFSKISEKVDTP